MRQTDDRHAPCRNSALLNAQLIRAVCLDDTDAPIFQKHHISAIIAGNHQAFRLFDLGKIDPIDFFIALINHRCRAAIFVKIKKRRRTCQNNQSDKRKPRLLFSFIYIPLFVSLCLLTYANKYMSSITFLTLIVNIFFTIFTFIFLAIFENNS